MKREYKFVTDGQDSPSQLTDVYFLYIDILGFADLVKRDAAEVAALYEVIATLNAHRHDSFGTIVFSDTILIYPKYPRGRARFDDKYAIMYLCEFAQDLLYRLAHTEINFRAVLTQGKFTHYFYNGIPCFFGPALIDAYRSEKEIKAIGLFMDNRCVSNSEVFRTVPFDQRFNFVFLCQTLEMFRPDSLYPVPFPDPALLRDLDLQWELAQDAILLRKIYVNLEHPNPAVRQKYQNTWSILERRYPEVVPLLIGNSFHPRAFCPGFDWSEAMNRARTNT